MTVNQTYLLIDGMSFLFRAFYATAWSGKIRQTSSGLYTNAVYGFTKMMLDYVDQIRPTHLIVAWDVASRETLVRSQWFPGYKANRIDPPAELVPQFDLVKEVTDAFGVPNIGCPGYEGDDILGTLSARLEAEGRRVVVATGDYDNLQLLSDQVSVIVAKNGGKQERYTPDVLAATRGIAPAQVVDVKALMGDSSDCIPGCPGIGEKTALKLVQLYGDLEGLYDQLDFLKPRLRDNLAVHREQVFLSRKLARIIRDVPVEVNWEEAEWSFDPLRVRRKLEELEFGRPLLSRVG